MGERERIAKAAGVMSLATFMSRVLGFMRDMVLAFFFGATGISDTFFVAFRIPNLLRELFAEGTMSAALVPVLSEYNLKDPAETRRLVRAAMAVVLLVVGAATLIGIIFAPAVVTVIAPGFLDEPGKFSLTVLLTRIMFPFLLFISLAALVMGALNTKRVFFVPALAPAVLNIVIIVTVVGFHSYFQSPIVAVAAGVALGGFAQFAFQAPSYIKNGYSLSPHFGGMGHPGLRKMLSLVLPATLGMAVAQINIVISNILASFLPGGSITYLFYSMRLVQFPIGVFGVAMGMAVLPSLSEHAQRGDFDSLRGDFSFALRLLFFITIPAMAGLIALGEPIVSTLFQRGQFDHAATLGTAKALLYYSFGVWAVVGARVTAATFYSMQDTRSPVKAAAVALVANIVLSLVLMGPMRHSGLALANALSSIINFTLLFYMLRSRLKRVGGIGARSVAASAVRTLLASSVMGLTGWMLVKGGPWARSGLELEKAGRLFGVIAVCIAVYIVVSYLLKSEELGFVLKLIKKRLNGGAEGDDGD